MEVSPFYKIKCLILGNTNVGKTSLFRFIHHDSHKPTEPTIGLAFVATDIELEEYPLSNPSKLPKFYYENVRTDRKLQAVKLHCWDASGNRRFEKIIDFYLRDVDICLLAFSMNDKESWDKIPRWREEVMKHKKYDELPLFILIGTKSDITPYTVSINDIRKVSEEWKCKYYILSAVQYDSAANIRAMIYNTVQHFHDLMLLTAHENKPLPEHVTISAYEKKNNYIDLDVESSNKMCCFQ